MCQLTSTRQDWKLLSDSVSNFTQVLKTVSYSTRKQLVALALALAVGCGSGCDCITNFSMLFLVVLKCSPTWYK